MVEGEFWVYLIWMVISLVCFGFVLAGTWLSLPLLWSFVFFIERACISTFSSFNKYLLFLKRYICLVYQMSLILDFLGSHLFVEFQIIVAEFSLWISQPSELSNLSLKVWVSEKFVFERRKRPNLVPNVVKCPPY